MRQRIIASLTVLVTVTVAASWGQEREKKAPPAKPAAVGAAQVSKGANDPAKSPTEPAATAGSASSIQNPAIERAIRVEADVLIAEYNSKNAKTFATQFVPNAEYEFDTRAVLVGRAEIESHFAKVFEKYPMAKAQYKETKIRLVTPQLAIEEGLFEVVHTQGHGESEDQVLTIWALSDGRWRVASMREIVARPKAGMAHERLNQLAWLIGDWVDESHESVVITTCRWSDDGNFLLRDFKVHVRGENVLSTTQRIGWDPLTQKIRGWFFDSNGGFGESFWNWNGEQWVVRVSSVREDGVIAASLDFLTPVRGDAYRWQSSHRMAGDEGLSDLDVVIVRQAPEPPKAVDADPAKSPSAATNRTNKN